MLFAGSVKKSEKGFRIARFERVMQPDLIRFGDGTQGKHPFIKEYVSGFPDGDPFLCHACGTPEVPAFRVIVEIPAMGLCGDFRALFRYAAIHPAEPDRAGGAVTETNGESDQTDRKINFPVFPLSPAVGVIIGGESRADFFPAGGVVVRGNDPLKTFVSGIQHPDSGSVPLSAAVGIILQFDFQPGERLINRRFAQIDFSIVLFSGIPCQTSCGAVVGTVRGETQGLIESGSVVNVGSGSRERIDFLRFRRQENQGHEEEYPILSHGNKTLSGIHIKLCCL